MTLTNQTSSVTLNGNGVTTLWPYSFIIPDDASARVGLFDIATSALTTLTDSDYSITGIGDDVGGEVTYPLIGAPISAAKRLVIWREVDYTQDTELTNQTPYYPKVLEEQLDRIVMQVQQLAEETGRSLKVTQGSTIDPDQFIEDLTGAAAAAQASADAAAASAAAAASQQLPNPGVALNYVRRNAGLTAYESRTPAQVLADIAAIGGSLGVTDNRLLRADGTGGVTAQGSGVTVDDSGNITAFGGNIKFPAVQSLSADVNTLDDYEEGTWTPAWVLTSGSVTYANQNGLYTKVGNVVTVSCWLRLASISSPVNVALLLSGLPFVAAASPETRPGVAMRANLVTVTGQVFGYLVAGSASITMTAVNNGAAAALSAATFLSNANSEVNFSFSYQV